MLSRKYTNKTKIQPVSEVEVVEEAARKQKQVAQREERLYDQVTDR
jgi:hypothetical protein